MLRLLKILAVTGLGLLLITGFLVFLGARVPEPASEAVVEGLTNEARISWFTVGGRPPRIEAGTEADALHALGFAQAQAIPWRLLLWRQAAAGRLAEWYGPGALPADRCARQLALYYGAARALATLSPADRAALDAFVAGVNAGLASDRARDDAQLTLMGVRPEAFGPLDVLAIERLVAWLGTSPRPPAEAERWPDVAAFRAGDARLRVFLRADGFDRSRLWSFADSTDARLVATYVTGSTARPLFFDAEVVVARRARTGVYLPGTPFAIAGAERAGPDGRVTRAWAAYPVSRVAWQPASQQRPRRRSERFVIEGGQESVQIVMATAAGLYFRSPGRRAPLRPRPVRPAFPDSVAARADSTLGEAEVRQRLAVLRQARRADSLWRADSVRAATPTALVLTWPGLEGQTDAAAWLALWRGSTPAFALFTGRFLATDGASAGATPHRRGLVVADSLDADALVARLDAYTALPEHPAQDPTSVASLTLNRRLVARLDTARLRRPLDREALTYLRNWTGTYERTSVAAMIFSAWVDAEERLNRLPAAALAADTAFFASVRRTQALQATLDTLVRRYGPDPRAWRWGEAVPHTRYFAGYGIPGLNQPARRRYAPLVVGGGGHPTALAYGPATPGGPSTTYTLDVSLRPERPVSLLRFDYDPSRFLARFRLPLATDPVPVDAATPLLITRLSPR